MLNKYKWNGDMKWKLWRHETKEMILKNDKNKLKFVKTTNEIEKYWEHERKREV